MEEELEQRVREALETPPLERAKRAEVNSKERKSCQTLNEPVIAPLEKRNPQVALVVCNSFSLTFEPVF
jgi:hypothetical protein